MAVSSVSVLWDNEVSARKYPSSSGMRFPLITTNTTAQLIIPLGTINVVVTIQTITRSITMHDCWNLYNLASELHGG